MRFTPPREMTPPHVYQTDYQSFQQITLCHPNSPSEDQTFDPVQYSQQTASRLHLEQPHATMNGHADITDSGVPVTPIKSSAVLVLK